ncbi:RNA polymerase, sigma-24 subunit, ECF subfamily [Desulfotomaculum nigrificans CO-1-SRB]|uniref:RNA polymerase, sigma-24 subunit, ECF subfamily n=1 Tax=Desulfotomaculum nigrificans (strain DSM 14880 / VKM B-2319 / CO-1-SRB) TaxID=868595 RepID=F6B9E5_DESCC|nr:sigma-70 family RNA polymerase sigma factor [Desulfotomaculum nigrificans]AEF93721.1 RNA polymerase, sigma-24 subunit, ECF subfamily [Desulfotomaculum nigrificans CO-1-SRB]
MTPATNQRHPDAELSFAELYDLYFAPVNRYLRYRLDSVWDADDLTTTVFMKALENFHKYRGDGPFAAWIFRITHNVYVDYMRGRREYAGNDVLLELAATSDGGPEEQILQGEELRKLRQLLRDLAPDYRDVVALRYAGDLKFAQIAQVLGKTESAVRMLHHRALKQLRSKYAAREGGMPDAGK